jgi:hypothetical protein
VDVFDGGRQRKTRQGQEEEADHLIPKHVQGTYYSGEYVVQELSGEFEHPSSLSV